MNDNKSLEIVDKDGQKKRKGRKRLLIILLALSLFTLVIFFLYSPNNTKVTYGVTFSKDFSQYLGLNWRENYLAILDDLKVKNLRLPIYWTEIEPQRGEYHFENVDWQIEEAQRRNVKIILVVGQKQPRWPECHIPIWVKSLSEEEREAEIKETLNTVINRYKNYSAVVSWQVENEPFLPYGECPKFDEDLLDKEIETVRETDPSRSLIVTDSGELSTWYDAANKADILGTTLYRIVWNEKLGYVHYPISSIIYRLKAAFITYITDIKKIIIVELQAEPWGPKTILETPLEEQYKSMNAEQFRKNIEYVNEVRFSEAYLWGSEWWYWLKTQKGDPSLWNEAKKVF